MSRNSSAKKKARERYQNRSKEEKKVTIWSSILKKSLRRWTIKTG